MIKTFKAYGIIDTKNCAVMEGVTVWNPKYAQEKCVQMNDEMNDPDRYAVATITWDEQTV